MRRTYKSILGNIRKASDRLLKVQARLIEDPEKNDEELDANARILVHLMDASDLLKDRIGP